ncbi:MAG: hypothetical protein WC238_05895 [Parcubacteria group bacterium]|jgi:hypothetical protein
MKSKKGQLTVFIIIGIVIVASVVLFFVLRNSLSVTNIPADLQPAYRKLVSCIEDETNIGVSVLESQGGYIELPEFQPGSEYMPFSSQLDFLGTPVPYWYYVSGNGIEKQQVPSKRDMEKQLENFIEGRIRECDFEEYYQQGMEINQGEPRARVSVTESKIVITLAMNTEFKKNEESAFVATYKTEVSSALGRLYDSAKKVYDYEQDSLFLEQYGVDTLRLYAPVDGVELSCSPKLWSTDEVFVELQDAIEQNTQSIKVKGGDYTLRNDKDEYFVANINAGDVNFLNSKEWAHSFEVLPSQGNALIAQPVGNQAGLGILGFCYVPYHFVYSMKYPILVQVSVGQEIFQFPLAVIIQGNMPRKALEADALEYGNEVCKYKNSQIEVRTFDSDLNSVSADISFECLGESCYIGKAENGILEGEFPQCANAQIIAKANGFEETKQVFSSVSGGSIDVILPRTHPLQVNLKLNGASYNGKAIINFIGDKSKFVSYPEQKIVELSEGDYEVQVYIYEESSMKLQGNYQQCVKVPSSILGIIQTETEKCFDVDIPEQIISNALAGGGKQEYPVTEYEIQNSKSIEINVQSLPKPSSLQQLQDNYVLFEEKGLEINLK